MGRDEKIRRTVGKLRPKRPLEQAFEFRRMLIELRGEREDSNYGHIRKTVGRPQSKRD